MANRMATREATPPVPWRRLIKMEHFNLGVEKLSQPKIKPNAIKVHIIIQYKPIKTVIKRVTQLDRNLIKDKPANKL